MSHSSGTHQSIYLFRGAPIMSRELVFGLRTTDTYITVEMRYRLQHRGSDVWLFANDDFGPSVNGDSELLKRILDLFRMNNSGIDKVQVFPFKLMVVNSTVVTPEYLEGLIRTAVLRAGFKPVFQGSMSVTYHKGDGISRTKVTRKMGQVGLNAVALQGGSSTKNASFEGELQYSAGGERRN